MTKLTPGAHLLYNNTFIRYEEKKGFISRRNIYLEKFYSQILLANPSDVFHSSNDSSHITRQWKIGNNMILYNLKIRYNIKRNMNKIIVI